MKVTSVIVVSCLVIALVGGWAIFQKKQLAELQADSANAREELNDARNKGSELQTALNSAQEEIKSLKALASEVHRLRGEVTTLRKDAESLQQQLKITSEKAARNQTIASQSAPQAAPNQLPTQFTSIEQMSATIAPLRSKAFGGGGLTEQEKQYLQQLKPQIEQLEKSPAEFASFQSAMIQSATGINDPAKLEQIKNVIQKVYENANSRGLDVTSRPQDDAAWKQQRFQLDRRGTSAVQNILSESERAAFDKSFLGVMGVDLGTGVDKSIYPDGFLGTETVNK